MAKLVGSVPNLLILTLNFTSSSPRENSNTKLLLDYMSHVFYGLKFRTEPQVVDRDAIFVPIGWDSPSKIALLSDGNYYYCF